MSATNPHFFRLLACAAAVLITAGCSSSRISVPMVPGITPYRIDIQQGNIVTQEMLDKLEPGMSRNQVRFILGTPLVMDPFRTDRWDYVYRMNKRGDVVEHRQLKVFFKDDRLERFEGDVVADVKPGDKPAAKPPLKPAVAAAKPDPLADIAKPAAKPAVKPAAAPAPVAQPQPAPALAETPRDTVQPQLRLAPSQGTPATPQEKAAAEAQAQSKPKPPPELAAVPLPPVAAPPEPPVPQAQPSTVAVPAQSVQGTSAEKPAPGGAAAKPAQPGFFGRLFGGGAVSPAAEKPRVEQPAPVAVVEKPPVAPVPPKPTAKPVEKPAAKPAPESAKSAGKPESRGFFGGLMEAIRNPAPPIRSSADREALPGEPPPPFK
jgi:outer membrane protein assembly factor BamE